MFSIDRDGTNPEEFRVVDEGREAELRFLRGGGGPEFDLFRLVTCGREVPILTETHSNNAERGYTRRVRYIGDTTGAEYAFDGEAPYRFATEAERNEVLLTAAEALLVYGDFYDGLKLSDGYVRVAAEIDGEARVVSLSDFGYVGGQS